MNDRERYYALHPRMRELFQYVLSHPVAEMPAGRVDIDGDALFVNIDDSVMQPAHERPLEAHRRYIDVQIPLTCDETFGWSPLAALPAQPDVPYSDERDIAFYHAMAQAYCLVKPGQFYVLFPDDAHAPLVGEGPIRKVIGKIRL